jgi:hypothetical protein
MSKKSDREGERGLKSDREHAAQRKAKRTPVIHVPPRDLDKRLR